MKTYQKPASELVGGFAFDLQLFATAPSYQITTLMLGKEITYGTGVTPTVAIVASTHGFDGTNVLIERPGARKRPGQTEQLTGLYNGKGSFSAEADADTLGAILLLAMGAESFGANTSNPAALAVSTTMSAAITSLGLQPFTVASMTNVVEGQTLTVDTAGNAENVLVRAVVGTTPYAVFTKTHANGVAVTNAAVVNAYDHTFTLASPRNSFTAQLNDVTNCKNALGCRISQLSFKLAPASVLEAQGQVMYQTEANVGTPTSPTYSTSRGFVLETPGGYVNMNGVSLDQSVQGIQIDLSVGLQAVPRMGQGRLQTFAETISVAKIKMDLAFETTTALAQFYGGVGATGPQSDVLPAQLQIGMMGTDPINTAVNQMLQIIAPKAKASMAPVARKAKDYLKQSISFETSESSNGAGDDIKFVLTNSSNAASL